MEHFVLLRLAIRRQGLETYSRAQGGEPEIVAHHFLLSLLPKRTLNLSCVAKMGGLCYTCVPNRLTSVRLHTLVFNRFIDEIKMSRTSTTASARYDEDFYITIPLKGGTKLAGTNMKPQEALTP